MELLFIVLIAAGIGFIAHYALPGRETRGGLLRAAVPRPIGTCHFVNDLSAAELDRALAAHRELCGARARGGDGVDMFSASTPVPVHEPV